MIKYAGGTRIFTTIPAASASTKTLLVDAVKAQLVLAGWSASGISGAWTLTSASSTSGVTGLNCQVVLSDAALANCAAFRMRRGDGTQDASTTHMPLLPGTKFKIWANKHQFFVWGVGLATARRFVGGGSLYVPTWMPVSCAIWGAANAQSDVDTTNRASFRDRLTCDATTMYVNVNGNQWGGTSSSGDGTPRIILPGNAAATSVTGRGWYGTIQGSDAVMAIGLAVNTPAFFVGQLWDALVLQYPVGSDSAIRVNNVDYTALTDDNQQAAGRYAGTLYLSTGGV